jgi:hypothetical protein
MALDFNPMKTLPFLLALTFFVPRLALADGVALAVQLPETVEAHHRAFAAGVSEEARQRWHVIMPPLAPSKVAACQADVKCLSSQAKTQDASHLLILGIAALGPAELVVSMRMLDLATGDPIFTFNEIKKLESLGNAQVEGAELGRRQLKRIQGPPPPRQEAPPPEEVVEEVVEEEAPISGMSIAGWVLLGVGAPVALAGMGTAAIAFALLNNGVDFLGLEAAAEPEDRRTAESAMWTGVGLGIAGAVFALGGLALVATAPVE